MASGNALLHSGTFDIGKTFELTQHSKKMTWKKWLEVYPEEYRNPLIETLDLLRKGNINLLGPNVPFMKKYWHFFYMIPLVTVHYASMITHIVLTEGFDHFQRADLPMFLCGSACIIKTVIIYTKQEKIREVIIQLGSSWRTVDLNGEQLKLKKKALKHLSYAVMAFSKFGIFFSVQFIMWPLCDTVIRRLLLNQDIELQLPYSCVYPFKIVDWPVYLAVYALQVFCTLYSTSYIYIGTFGLLVVLTLCLNIQFLLLQEDLIKINPKDNKEGLDHSSSEEVDGSASSELKPKFRIEDFVRRHQDAILLSNNLNAACGQLTFTIMLFVTLIISLLAVSIKETSGVGNLVNCCGVTFVVMFNIYILCYCSERLCSSSSGIAIAAAKTLWYNGDLRYQKIIQFIIVRAQKPCYLTFLDTFPIRLETFSTVLKTTWSYFSLASNMYEESV